MHLAISLLGYAPPPRPWTSDYCAGIVPELVARPEVHDATLLVTPYGRRHWRHLASERVRLLVVEGLDERKRRRFYAERYLLPRMLRELAPDAVFAPLGGSLLHPGARYAYRLASLAWLAEPERFSTLEQMFYGTTIPPSCRAADCVLVDHAQLADAVAERGLAPRSAVRVVSPGSGLALDAEALPAGLAPGRYLLCAGGDGDAQLARLLDDLLAQTRLPRGWEDVVLVRCGRSAAESRPSARLLAIHDAPPRVYAALVRGCAAALCLSAGESGLHPLRQALSAGRAVLSADTPAHRAVAGSAAQYVAPYGLAETASALAVLLADEAQRGELAQAAAEFGTTIQWPRAAEAVCASLAPQGEGYGATQPAGS